MAQRKGYLESQRAFGIRSTAVAWGALVVVFVAVAVVLANLYGTLGATPVFGAVCLLATCGLVWLLMQLWPAMRNSKTFVKRYESGIAGERAVWDELYHLPLGYRVYHDLQLAKGATNIDFVVTGPCGVVVVEVKNNFGRVTASTAGLFIGGRPAQTNMLGQATFEARSLAQFLEAKATGKINVVSVLVFANPKTYVDVYGQVRGVHVLHLRQLVPFLVQLQGGVPEKTIQTVNNLLDLLVKR